MPLYQSLYDCLKNQHEAISHIILNIDPKRLEVNPSPGKWSIHDNIAHLARYQPVFIDRIKTILLSNEPLFERYKAEDDPAFENWRKRRLDELIATLNTDRQEIFTLVTGLTDKELSRMGQHIKFGRLTVVDWLQFFALHEAHHIFTIFQIANNREI